MGKVARAARASGERGKGAPHVRPVYMYFVAFLIVKANGNNIRNNMIVHSAVPIRDISQIRVLEAQLREAIPQSEAERLANLGKSKAGEVIVTNVSMLEHFLVELSPEEVEALKARKKQYEQEQKTKEKAALMTEEIIAEATGAAKK